MVITLAKTKQFTEWWMWIGCPQLWPVMSVHHESVYPVTMCSLFTIVGIQTDRQTHTHIKHTQMLIMWLALRRVKRLETGGSANSYKSFRGNTADAYAALCSDVQLKIPHSPQHSKLKQGQKQHCKHRFFSQSCWRRIKTCLSMLTSLSRRHSLKDDTHCTVEW